MIIRQQISKKCVQKNSVNLSNCLKKSSSMYLKWYLKQVRISTLISSRLELLRLQSFPVWMTTLIKIFKQRMLPWKTNLIRHPRTLWSTISKLKQKKKVVCKCTPGRRRDRMKH